MSIEESPYDFFARDDVVQEYASFDFLLRPEETIREALRDRLPNSRMLDLGVGAGRTTAHFAELVREYVGVDCSKQMIAACEKRFSGFRDGRISFLTADARALTGFDSDSFDLVLFSFNGLDIVGDQNDRRRALEEMCRVCRPGGICSFSSHNLKFALAGFSVAKALYKAVRSKQVWKNMGTFLKRPRLLLRMLAYPWRWKSLNEPPRELVRRGQAMIVEERPRYEFSQEFYTSPEERILVKKCYVTPTDQIQQLAAIGFERVRVFAPDGSEVTHRVDTGLAPCWWLYYLCQKSDK